MKNVSNFDDAVGIVCEYNPFHNGHALHLERARQASGARYAVCVMSGPFVQRGDVAIVDKWARARMALGHGADVVLELPAAVALRAAPDFAAGAVALLSALGCVSHIAFGSELPLEALMAAVEESPDQSQAIQGALRRGESYPRAVSAAGMPATDHPNATLGIEYLRAMEPKGIAPIVVPRQGSQEEGIGRYSSASVVRKALREGIWPDVALPESATPILRAAMEEQGELARMERLYTLLLDRLRSLPKGALEGLPGGGEGLGNRLIAAARQARSLADFYAAVKCKRYTMARIRRLAAWALLNPSPEALSLKPAYARVLGFRREALPLLRRMDRQGNIPLITKLPKADLLPGLALDIRAQELWALACASPMRGGMDYAHPVVIV